MISNTAIRQTLVDLGYRTGNIVSDYKFAALDQPNTPVVTTAWAAFFDEPPSYRNAALAVVRVPDAQEAEQAVSAHRSLGAPFLLAVDSRKVTAWVMTLQGAKRIDASEPKDWNSLIARHQGNWRMDAVRRLKAIDLRTSESERQRLLFDPAVVYQIQKQIQVALDAMLDRFLMCFASSSAQKSALSLERDSFVIFPLVFRLLAAKILFDRSDRRVMSTERNDVLEVLARVGDLYSLDPLPLSGNKSTTSQLRAAWQTLVDGVYVRNIAAEDLAFIYENTLITPSARKALGTHSTPVSVADYIVRSFDFPSWGDLQTLHVYEPFAGSCVFLTAAMRRFKELLPLDWTAARRHRHLVSHFAASELDQFASEVARLSLILADYPNANGWHIHNEDLFDGATLDLRLQTADVVVCNPPFEDFGADGRMSTRRSVHKPIEVLTRVLEHKPSYLGIVMPNGFDSHRKYASLVERCVRDYGDVEILKLPEGTFVHAAVGAVALIAQRPKSDNNAEAQTRLRRTSITRTDFARFERTLVPTQLEELDVKPSVAPGLVGLKPLKDIWEALHGSRKLGDVAEIHRGLEWNCDQRLASTLTPRRGFVRGLHRLRESISQYRILQTVYLNCQSGMLRGGASERPWDREKVICSAARMSRKPWRIAAVHDVSGLVLSQQFFGIWARDDTAHSFDLQHLAAILNSPLANAYSFVHDPDQRLRVDTMLALPLPPKTLSARATGLIQEYAGLSSQDGPLFGAPLQRQNDLLLALDAEVLSAYDLHPRSEKALRKFMGGDGRPCGHEFGPYPLNELDGAISLTQAIRVRNERLDVRRLWQEILQPLPTNVSDVFELT